MKRLTLCFIASLILSFNAFSYEAVLSVTDNDDNNEIYNLVVLVDDETQSLKELYKDTYVGSVKVHRDLLDPKALSTKQGVVLEQRKGYNVLSLKSDNFDYDRGGRITIDTLYSGISGERRGYDVELAKDLTGWKLFSNNKIVSKFHVKVNKKLIIGTIGIKTLRME